MSQKQSKTNIDFMSQRRLAAGFSLILLVVALSALFTRGLNLGLDFTGGTQMRLEFQSGVELNTVRGALEEQGFEDAVAVYYGSQSEVLLRFQGSLQDVAVSRINSALEEQGLESRVQSLDNVANAANLGSEIRIAPPVDRAAIDAAMPEALYGPVDVLGNEDGATALRLESGLEEPISDAIVTALQDATGSGVTVQDLSYVGSQVGEEMAENAVIGMLTALGIVLLYVALRFQYKFGVGAVAALAHDVLVVVGLFALTQMTVDLTVFAAVLAVIGYSLNDTIVVSDRIRENFRKVRKGGPVEVINTSLNQTIGRTVVTSMTTLLVLFALFFFGGEVIRGFSVALILGVLVGTYSSIYVAANTMLAMHVNKEDLMVPVKEGAEFDEMP